MTNIKKIINKKHDNFGLCARTLTANKQQIRRLLRQTFRIEQEFYLKIK